MVLAGCSNRQIAAHLGLDPIDVDHVIGTAKRRLEVRRRHEAAVITLNQRASPRADTGTVHRIGDNNNHNERQFSKPDDKMDVANKERVSLSMYIRTVGSDQINRRFRADVDDEARWWTNLLDILIASPLNRSIMMMLIVVMVGVIALSTMISALKGLNDLLSN